MKKKISHTKTNEDLDTVSDISTSLSDELAVTFKKTELTTELRAFVESVAKKGRELYRDLPWRRTYDPYAIWISEVMLQQTQVSRVDGRWQRWLEHFPTVDALAAAAPSDVLEEWQGLGYNRRALSVHRAAQAISEAGGVFPQDQKELVKLPGIGPATAAGIRAFAFNLHGVYLETNVRTVFLHELYPQAEGVPDSELIPLVELTCPASVSTAAGTDTANAATTELTPRSWYYALLDYGAYLKKTIPNPSRRSKSHVKQSRFEGSHRQKRAELLRVLLAHKDEGGAEFETLHQELCQIEVHAGRETLDEQVTLGLLEELAKEGFCQKNDEYWLP
ncbi:HhH-GPD family protein [Lancefieldella parvula DSM 20469]|uniref:Adenine DNA glycosylase n=1 Tax=Lancefieldella parvula (strain ATCC 33793 / DSM 20469 / CCUG 32760 / JCM 10300 / KCTC 3663 / VPI 0546 / 1246) TaxID=521095 RepID=C8W8W9_LANP1|nr:adenine glycosylase [Lancefieldella parvula]ACV50557.1 HhH-GPD family protein [Lancefieldella parvula DSM 20469]